MHCGPPYARGTGCCKCCPPEICPGVIRYEFYYVKDSCPSSSSADCLSKFYCIEECEGSSSSSCMEFSCGYYCVGQDCPSEESSGSPSIECVYIDHTLTPFNLGDVVYSGPFDASESCRCDCVNVDCLICSESETLNAVVTIEGCDNVPFVLNENVPGDWSGSNQMGICICPESFLDTWTFLLNCANGIWNMGLDSPNGFTDITSITVLSSVPLEILATGTLTCAPNFFPVSITITE
jgi:hypothetical protein